MIVTGCLSSLIDPRAGHSNVCMVKIRCEICGVEGQLQHLSQNYFRVKHYGGSKEGKHSFTYHRQSPEYAQRFLDKPYGARAKIDPIDPRIIDLSKPRTSYNCKSVVRSLGFEPRTSGDVSRVTLFFSLRKAIIQSLGPTALL